MKLRALGGGGFPAERRSELALVALLAAIVAMMVVPLPTALIDLFIAVNLGLGILLVATALYVRDLASFGAFPTIVLLATLYRLALNVASTRLILLQADAGRVIEAFGKFVVRGDYLVGAMVFAVLTVVQFLVIARGAERVAEVGARFSLDALPGKQLAIDAELRAGTLSSEGARAARRALERESALYGAMDGAMKFVKGDAIAGIVIALVNFIGGVAIGVTARGLSAADSLATYGLLTIGDGLVTQISALLTAMAAGLVVTRAGGDAHGSLANDIAGQLFGDARVLFAATLLLALLALVPGLPFWPFAVTAATCATMLVAARKRAVVGARPLPLDAHAQRELLALELSPELAAVVAPGARPSPALDRALGTASRTLEQALGLGLPELRVRAVGELSGRSYRVAWRELQGPHEQLADGADEAALAASIVQAARRHADDLLHLDRVQDMLRTLEREAPALVRLTVPKPVSPQLLARVLRLLVREGVSVRWLPEILEAIAVEVERDERPEALAEVARQALARRISQALAPDGKLHVLRLSPELDEALSDALKRDGQREWLALAPDLARDITQAISEAHTHAPRPHALVVDPPLRRHVRTLIAERSPELPVVTAFELTPQLRLEPLTLVGP